MTETGSSEIAVFVFSGTGNTLKCAEYLCKELNSVGAKASLYKVESGREDFSEVIAATSVAVICYPVHGFNAPYNIVDFVKKWNRSDADSSKSVYFLKTSGEPLKLNDNSSNALRKRLVKKGYRCLGEYHYVMPYNMIFRHSDEMAAKMWNTAKERIKIAAQEIAALKPRRKRTPVSAFLMSGICKIERFGMRLSGKFYKVDTAKCIRCEQCVSACPVHNVSVKGGKFKFGNHCFGCMRCSFNCPQNAIKIGLLNFMKVNGRYDFSADSKKAKIGKYCRKAYARYFYGDADKTQEIKDQKFKKKKEKNK